MNTTFSKAQFMCAKTLGFSTYFIKNILSKKLREFWNYKEEKLKIGEARKVLLDICEKYNRDEAIEII